MVRDMKTPALIELDTGSSIWESFFTVFPLVVIGTREADGGDDLAPKHMAMPMSWSNHFGFVCTPRHNTYQNIQRDRQFTVTYMRPSQTVLASLAATPRCDDGSKPITQSLPTFAAQKVDAAFVADGYLFLECELHQMVDDLGDNSLIIGRIIGARIAEDALRSSGHDDEDLVFNAPLLAYLYPGTLCRDRQFHQATLPSRLQAVILMNVQGELLEYLHDQQDAMVALVKDLVLIETPSTEAASQAAILAYLKSEFEQVDYRVILLPGKTSGGHLYAAPRARGKRQKAQLVIGHCDTVWPIGTLQTMPLICESGTLRGPGVYDMKAGLAQMIYALKAIRSLGLEAEVRPLFFINSDEEIGSRESTRYLRALAQCSERCLVLEPSLGRSGKIKTSRKGVGRFTVSVQGKAAHAGLDPGAGASAILELSHVIQKLFELNDPEHGTSVNVGVIDGGIRPNMVAPESRAVVDVRVLTPADAERVAGAIHALKAETPGVTLRIEGAIGRPPMEPTEANQRLWRIAQTLGVELGLALEQGTAGGGSDGNTTSLYSATLDGLGAVGDGAHATHEFIDLDRLGERCALLTLLLLAPSLTSRSDQRS